MNREILLAADQLSRYYGDYCAVRDVSFTIKRGEVLGFLGPNGAGKTTTMLMLSGVLPAHNGTVKIAGIDMAEQPQAAKQHIGFLPEQPPLYTDLSVDEYLRFAARLRGIRRAGIAAAVASSKSRCGLENSGARLIRNLSKGYQQRVGIAQAIIHAPAAVILDEPTSGLDPIQIREIRQLIKELGTDHSVILSTHILPEVQSVCDRVLIINQGRLVMDRALDQLNAENRDQCLRLMLKNPPQTDILAAIDGVRRVETLTAQRFRLHIDPGSNITDTLLQQALAGNWGLQELAPEKETLEEIFMQLTSGQLPDTGAEVAA